MSHNIAPLPPQLFAEKRVLAEQRLGCAVPVEPNDDLYIWAGKIVDALTQQNHPNPKLALAQALDIPTEPRWRGTIAPERNLARHRVIARFAREGLWGQIWTFNWDCVQESALENVGIARDGVQTGFPWPTGFRTLITAEDCGEVALENIVVVVKPHGCVDAIDRAAAALLAGNLELSRDLANRFLITAGELASIGPVGAEPIQQFIFAQLCSAFATHPLVVAGWRADELYFLDYLDQVVRPILSERANVEQDDISIVDIVFNAGGHTRLAGFYGKNQDDAHIPVAVDVFTTNSLFLWLQALYALGCLRGWASPEQQLIVDQLLFEIDQPPDDDVFVINWVDSFLPVWVRLCWRSELIQCIVNFQQIPPSDIPLEGSRDFHIPWHVPSTNRPDLAAAAGLLVALQNSGHAEDWDFDSFPGGLYRLRDKMLLIPLPCWNVGSLNNLRGLKALTDSMTRFGPGYVGSVGIAFLQRPGDPTPTAAEKTFLKQLLASELPLIHFAQPENLEEIELAAL